MFKRYLTFCGIGIQNAQLFDLSMQESKRNQVGGGLVFVPFWAKLIKFLLIISTLAIWRHVWQLDFQALQWNILCGSLFIIYIYIYILEKIEFWLLGFIVEGIKIFSSRIRILFQSFRSKPVWTSSVDGFLNYHSKRKSQTEIRQPN